MKATSLQPVNAPTPRRRSKIIPIALAAALLIIVVSMMASIGGSHRHPQLTQTKETLRTLTDMLTDYRAQTGHIPPDVSSLVSSAITMPPLKKFITALPPVASAKTPGGGYTVLDAFGNPIALINNPANPRSPYFQSAGPDGAMGSVDDIFSYDPN